MKMNYRICQNILFWVTVCLAVVLIVGCAKPKVRPAQICPERTLTEAIAALDQRRDQAKPVSANGTVGFSRYEDEKKVQQENLNMTLRLYPPYNLFLRADFFGSETLRLGTNQQEFWFRFKAGQISRYYWGQREDIVNCGGELPFGPDTLLEALGIIETDAEWVLSSDAVFDVLTAKSESGKPSKKLFINRCDYTVKRLEYFDNSGAPIAEVVLEDYTDGKDGIIVPKEIEVTSYDGGVRAAVIKVVLRNVKLFEPSEKQLKGKLFERPDEKGFEQVYKLEENCRFVGQ